MMRGRYRRPMVTVTERVASRPDQNELWRFFSSMEASWRR
jgi:hypothetical protein